MLTHEMYILGTAAHLCRFPSCCAFNDFSKVNDVQGFIDGMYLCYMAIVSQIPNNCQYRNWEPIFAKLSSCETLDSGKSFTPKKDYVPCWNHAQATSCYLSILGTDEHKPIERLREVCRRSWSLIKDRYELEGVWGFHFWAAFYAEIDTSAFFSLDDDAERGVDN